jgi:hypothetical protein
LHKIKDRDKQETFRPQCDSGADNEVVKLSNIIRDSATEVRIKNAGYILWKHESALQMGHSPGFSDGSQPKAYNAAIKETGSKLQKLYS